MNKKLQNAINTIVDYGIKNSRMVNHFIDEAKIAWKDSDGLQDLMVKQIIELLSLLSLQGDTNNTIGYKISQLNNAINFGIIAPLTFSDEEFGTDIDDEQNKRLTNIFRDKNTKIIYDVNGFTKKEVAKYDIFTKKLTIKDGGCWSGSLAIYNEETNVFKFVKSKSKVINFINFRGNNKTIIPSICIYDSRDNKNDFIAYVTKNDYIDNKFYKDYEFIEFDSNKFIEEKTILEKYKEDIVKQFQKLNKNE